MEKIKKAGLRNYLPSILMTGAVFAAASVIFAFILKMSDPVPVFIFFAVVQILMMLLFVILPVKIKLVARKISMLIVGSTILILAGILGKQNFQLEGLIFLILGGFFGGPVIHFIMKIGGTFFTGRSWCSWGCWTAMVLDFLPYKNKTEWWKVSYSRIRYAHFVLSILAVAVLFTVFGYSITEGTGDPAQAVSGNNRVVYWFIAGNILYYLAGIVLAVRMKDNRAFCKYLCPVAVPLKLSASVSLLRIKGDNSKCSGCKKCEESCPASIKIHSYIEKCERVASTECMMCLNCIAVCPEGNLKSSIGMDFVRDERLSGLS